MLRRKRLWLAGGVWLVAAGVFAAIQVTRPDTAEQGPARVDRLIWEDFHGVRLPRSAVHGPARIDGDLAAGFAPTRTGALLAALHIAVRANAAWGKSVYVATIERQVIGADAEALLTATRAADKDLRPEDRQVSVVYEGYRWASFTPRAASVDVLSAGPGPDGMTARASIRISVRWQDGDWRVVAPRDGDWAMVSAPVTPAETGAYTPWHGSEEVA